MLRPSRLSPEPPRRRPRRRASAAAARRSRRAGRGTGARRRVGGVSRGRRAASAGAAAPPAPRRRLSARRRLVAAHEARDGALHAGAERGRLARRGAHGALDGVGHRVDLVGDVGDVLGDLVDVAEVGVDAVERGPGLLHQRNGLLVHVVQHRVDTVQRPAGLEQGIGRGDAPRSRRRTPRRSSGRWSECSSRRSRTRSPCSAPSGGQMPPRYASEAYHTAPAALRGSTPCRKPRRDALVSRASGPATRPPPTTTSSR